MRSFVGPQSQQSAVCSAGACLKVLSSIHAQERFVVSYLPARASQLKLGFTMNIGPGSGSAAILDLKAELLRKYNDVEKKNRSETVDPFTVRKGGFRVETRKPKERKTEHVPPPDDGEEEALSESRRRLEEKARLYDLKKAETWTEDTEDALIDFNRKRKLERKHQEEAEEDDSDSDGEWTTFEDALGRTRKCLKTDLPHYLSENRRLTESLRPNDPRPGASTENVVDHIPLPGEPPQDPQGDTIEPNDVDPGKEERLKKWNEIELQNFSKEHLHYRDVLFDEIREHGQAHFEFSRDETERAHQMKILDKLREDSIRAQRIAQDVKRSREQMQRERLNKIRLRKGLAPEPEKPAEPTPPPPPPPPAPPSLPPAVPTSHVRPWDEGKEVHGVPIRAPPKRDYYEQCREERPSEFAPPQSYNDRYGKASSTSKTKTPDVSEFLRSIRDSM